MVSVSATVSVQRLYFVFAADSGLLAALMDSAKKVLRLKGCALCSITHGLVGERSQWRSCREAFGVPSEYVHQDELTPALSAAVDGRLPCVLAEDSSGNLHRVLEPIVLERCGGSISELRGKLHYHLGTRGLQLPEADHTPTSTAPP